MRLVERQGREHGIDLVPEIGPHPVDLRRRELLRRPEMMPSAASAGLSCSLPAAVLVLHQRGNDRMDPPQLLPRPQAVGPGLGDAGIHLLHEAGDPDFEEFVEVGADDRQEPHALEQGMAGFWACSSTRRSKASQLNSRLK